jgi:hypothetical protein
MNSKTLSTNITNSTKGALNTIKNKVTTATNAIKNVGTTVKETIQNKVGNVTQKIGEVTKSEEIAAPLTKWGSITQEFLNSNTAISKFVGFFLCLLLFVILFQFGMGIIQKFFGPSFNPYVLNGMVQSDKITEVSANPNIKGSVPIYRSINENEGIEFSWNVWFFINEQTTFNFDSSRIFSKGKMDNTNVNTLNMDINNAQYLNLSPGLFLKKNGDTYNLELIINTYDSKKNVVSDENDIYEKIIIENIPIQKWVSTTIVCQGKTINVYINGLLTKSVILINIPKQNYYDTYIGDSDGFKGYISSLRYYGYAIGYDEVQSLFASGPSLKMLKTSDMPASTDYLSINWYFN